MERREPAIASCRRALELSDRSENQTALALALVTPPSNEADNREARDLSERATRGQPGDLYGWMVRCQVGITMRDAESLGPCSERLRALAPGHVMGWYYGALNAGGRGRLDEGT